MHRRTHSEVPSGVAQCASKPLSALGYAVRGALFGLPAYGFDQNWTALAAISM